MLKNRKTIKIQLLLAVMLMSSVNLFGQKKFSLEPYLYGGREFNIFKSPELLYDRGANQYIDTLIISDNFIDIGFDSKFEIKKKKDYKLEVGTDLWSRHYFSYSNANQNRLGTNVLFEKILSKKAIVGAEYNFSWNDKIGTTISGEELMRSFKYLKNGGEVFFEYTPLKTIEFVTKISTEKKKYYKDVTTMPLDHKTLEGEFEVDYTINKQNSAQVNIDLKDRKYDQYYASDSLGGNSPNNGFRHLKYFSFGLDYNYKLNKRISINPYFDYSIRKDLFQDYYSYSGKSPGVRFRYNNKKFYAYVNTAYRNIKYAKRYAYTLIKNSNLLEYKYIKYYVKLKYKWSKKIEFYAEFSSQNRNSNTELEYVRTRRPYNNNQVLLGLNFKLIDYKVK